jgi:hypothetical protein
LAFHFSYLFSCAEAVLIFFIADLLYLLRFERVDNLEAYSIPSETDRDKVRHSAVSWLICCPASARVVTDFWFGDSGFKNLESREGFVGKKTLCLFLLCAIAVVMPARGQTQPNSGLQLYDSFDGRFINPSKWTAQWQCGGTVMECVREIQEDQLRLRVRAYGATNTNDGTQFGGSGLTLTTSSVSEIAADLMVRRSTAQACSTNPGFGGGGHAQVLIFGSFFNGGAGTTDDDVEAYLQLDHYATLSPGVVDVGGFLFHQGQFFGNVDLGLVNVGERVREELLWEQPNHRFVVRLFRPSSGISTEQFMPYAISDVSPPVSPSKNIDAFVYPANCAGTRTSAELEVLFDDVFTK